MIDDEKKMVLAYDYLQWSRQENWYDFDYLFFNKWKECFVSNGLFGHSFDMSQKAYIP